VRAAALWLLMIDGVAVEASDGVESAYIRSRFFSTRQF
jgi:hypothetical protein